MNNLNDIEKQIAKLNELKKKVELEEKKSKQNIKSFDWTDMGMADRMADQFGNVIRYIYRKKAFYVYDGKVWKKDTGAEIDKISEKVIKNMDKENYQAPDDVRDAKIAWDRFKRSKASVKSRKNMVESVKNRIAIDADDFSKDDYLINLNNGIYNLKENKLLKHDSKYMMNKIIDIDYDENAKCPQWDKFIKETFKGDKDLIRFIQQLVGYYLTGSTKEQIMTLFIGNGRNGKSVLLSILQQLAGNYSNTISSSSLMVKKNDNSSHDIARLENARLVVASEINDGERINESLVKSLTGSDKLVARYLYGSEFEYTPHFKIVMASNTKPVIHGDDDGIWRRLMLIPFNYQVPMNKIDRDLENKLSNELQGILNWAIKGFNDWYKNGLIVPKIVQDENTKYRNEMNSIDNFLFQNCNIDDNATVKSSQLYKEYSKWCNNTGSNNNGQNRFYDSLSKKYKKVHLRDGNYYQGLQLNNNSKITISY